MEAVFGKRSHDDSYCEVNNGLRAKSAIPSSSAALTWYEKPLFLPSITPGQSLPLIPSAALGSAPKSEDVLWAMVLDIDICQTA